MREKSWGGARRPLKPIDHAIIGLWVLVAVVMTAAGIGGICHLVTARPEPPRGAVNVTVSSGDTLVGLLKANSQGRHDYLPALKHDARVLNPVLRRSVRLRPGMPLVLPARAASEKEAR